MQTPAPTQPISTDEKPFFAALMTHLMDGTMIPKVQVERSIGPVIGFFLADVLETLLDEEIVMLCPEFPIRKVGNNQSTNIDWLMLNLDKQEVLLVELKTTDTTFREEQAAIYKGLQDAIAREGSAEFLIDDLLKISEASQEGGKYRNVLRMLTKACGATNEVELREKLRHYKSASVIYLVPQAMRKPANWPQPEHNWTWLSFGELPKSLGERSYAEQWPALRRSLVSLDEMDRRMRNGDEPSVGSVKNYLDLLDFDDLLDRCRLEGASIVVGLMNWRSALPAMTLEQLRAKTYKCDQATNGVGKKIKSNWIAGDLFLEQVTKLRGG